MKFTTPGFRAANLNKIEVATSLKSGVAAHVLPIGGKSNPPLDAIHGGIRFAPEVRIPRYIHRDVGATRKLRKTEVQAAARDLHAEFVKGRAADGGVMLKGKAEIARLVQTGARARILTEDLILRG